MSNVEETYSLTVGTVYSVAGMILWENVLFVLVHDDAGAPCAARAALFAWGSQSIPGDWRFSLHSGIRSSGESLLEQPLGAVWGYKELVDRSDHLRELLEKDAVALEIFKRQMENAD